MKVWTEADNNLFRKMWRQGKSEVELMEHFGIKTRSKLSNHRKVLGLTPRSTHGQSKLINSTEPRILETLGRRNLKNADWK